MSAPDSAASEPAMLAGRLHTLMDRYEEATVAFIESGGYKISKRVPGMACCTYL